MKNGNSDTMQDTVRSLCGQITDLRTAPLDPRTDMPGLAARFARLDGTVLLLSGGESDCARYHILGALPWMTLRAKRGETLLSAGDRSRLLRADPFDVLQACVRGLSLPKELRSPPLSAGLLGYLAYDLKDCLEILPRTSIDETGLPSMLFYAPSMLVIQDRREQSTRLLIPVRNGDRREAEQVLRRFDTIAGSDPAEDTSRPLRSRNPVSNFARPEYEDAVRKVIDYIAAGDAYQVNLSQRFEIAFDGDAFSLFRDLFHRNPAPFFAFIQAGDHQIVSTSPERFLLQIGQRVETRPIKGTRPRMSDLAEDAAMRRELSESAKDDAELSMIVDLLRNDIGKVCRAGSVRVAEHKRMEAYENVYHLVSIVEGELDREKDSVDLIKAAFPGGSITGCPKVRAMEIIDELETCRRHVYCGSIGYIGFHDVMDLSIAIRTAVVFGRTVRYSVGGGIVFDSDPEAEYEETLHKGRTLMAACSNADRTVRSPVAWLNGRLVPAETAAIPADSMGLQYGFGFFETVRADDGKAPLLRYHADRFEKTWNVLMPDAPPDLTWEVVLDQVLAANRLRQGCATVKILAARGSRTSPPWNHDLLVTARPYTHRLADKERQGLTLVSYPQARQNPLAAFKTLNYLYYFRAGQWARGQGFDEALILNPDGSISETNTANLLLINGRRAIRPLSAAVLPGVMAEAVCRQLAAWGYEIFQKETRPSELLDADQVLATNALMGAVPVIDVDGRERPAGDDLWHRLNDVIIPGWRYNRGILNFSDSSFD